MTNDQSTQKNQNLAKKESSCESLNSIEQSLSKWIGTGLVEAIHKHFGKSAEEIECSVSLSQSQDISATQDIIVTNKSTGDVIGVFKTQTPTEVFFELCQDIHVKVKTKELQKLKKETIEAKNLTKEQHGELKTLLNSIGNDRPLTRKEIATIIEEIRKPRKNKTYRQPLELIGNKLDRFAENGQLTFFDVLENQNKLIKDIPNSSPIIKGLDLDQSEDRILQTLSLLLHEKSENKDQKSPNYYMGNHGKGIISVNQVEMETARIAISPHEFYSKYYGKASYGSDQITFLLNKLDCLSKKMFLTSWKFPTGKKNKKGEETFTLFRTNLPLFQMALLNENLSEVACDAIMTNELILEGKSCQILFKFQPQFTRNIKTMYVEFPEDIHLRISGAVGKDRYGQHINLMRDFLFREKQAGKKHADRYTCTRDKKTLIQILKLDKFLKEGRKKMVNEKIMECLDVFKKLGLIIEWEQTLGKEGQEQYRIRINPDFK